MDSFHIIVSAAVACKKQGIAGKKKFIHDSKGKLTSDLGVNLGD